MILPPFPRVLARPREDAGAGPGGNPAIQGPSSHVLPSGGVANRFVGHLFYVVERGSPCPSIASDEDEAGMNDSRNAANGAKPQPEPEELRAKRRDREEREGNPEGLDKSWHGPDEASGHGAYVGKHFGRDSV